MRVAFASATGTPLCLKPGRRPPIRLASPRILASRVLVLNPSSARHPSSARRLEGAQT
jgi:hypothetical protein